MIATHILEGKVFQMIRETMLEASPPNQPPS
jgi:hypothetical protein